MVGIGCMARFGRREHQPVATQQPIKTVTAGHHHIRIIQAAEHNPKLITTYAWILRTDFLYTLQNSPLQLYFFFYVYFPLVESLTAMAKQTAHGRDLQATTCDQFRCYLAPDFFLIWMLKYSSARVIIKSRASVSRREKDKDFSSSLMRFFNCAFSSR